MTYDPANLPETDVIVSVFTAQLAIQDANRHTPTGVFHELNRLYAHCLIRDEVDRRAQVQRDAEVEDNREIARSIIRAYFADPNRDNREAAKDAAYRFGWKHSQAANDSYDKIATKSDPRADFTVSPAYARWFRDYVEPEWRELVAEPTQTQE